MRKRTHSVLLTLSARERIQHYIMALLKIPTARVILIEDDYTKNHLPLLRDSVFQNINGSLQVFCYDHPIEVWQNVLRSKQNTVFYEEFEINNIERYCISPTAIFIDSVQQMVLSLGWKTALKSILQLKRNPNVTHLVIISHKDCLISSNINNQLRHIANAVVTTNTDTQNVINITIKKNGKIQRYEELLQYDFKNNILKSTPVLKESKETNVSESTQPSPANLSTFKIEVDQTNKLEKVKLKLPYMSKIREGGSKVIYEPDAVDDWDDEDPDDDLDI